ncbi:MAG: hypothetical protein AAF408_16615 [Pseudomonadota bacterium]
MSFVRPEVKALLWRWREILAATFIALVGLSWITIPGGLLAWLGMILLIASGALAVIGVQRGRFRNDTGGPGIVIVDEGEITYMGPLTGGSIAAADLTRLVLDPTAKPAHWVLYRPGEQPLHIPVTAEGSDLLFDVFASLPGLRTERMLAELRGGSPHPVVIWERQSMRPPEIPLH